MEKVLCEIIIKVKNDQDNYRDILQIVAKKMDIDQFKYDCDGKY